MSRDHDAENGVATIDHEEIRFSPRRPDSYSKATSRDMIREEKTIVTRDLQNTQRQANGRAVTDQPTTIVAQKPDKALKPKDYVVTSWGVIIFCNFIFGIIAYCYGLKAYYAWQMGDLDLANRKARMAMLFVGIGVIVGVLTYILAISLIVCCSDIVRKRD